MFRFSGRPPGEFSQRQSKQSTVGLMVQGRTVDNLVVGGPAHRCGLIAKGDIILKVNNIAVLDESCLLDLLGDDDIPGSKVEITLQKRDTNTILEIALIRVATEAMAERHRMFELFTELKDRAIRFDDFDWASHTVDECIDVWTNALMTKDNFGCAASLKLRQIRQMCSDISAELAACCFICDGSASSVNPPDPCNHAYEATFDLSHEFNSVLQDMIFVSEEATRVKKCIELFVLRARTKSTNGIANIVDRYAPSNGTGDNRMSNTVNQEGSESKSIDIPNDSHVSRCSGVADIRNILDGNLEHFQEYQATNDHFTNLTNDLSNAHSSSGARLGEADQIREGVVMLMNIFQDFIQQVHQQNRFLQDELSGSDVRVQVLKAILRSKNFAEISEPDILSARRQDDDLNLVPKYSKTVPPDHVDTQILTNSDDQEKRVRSTMIALSETLEVLGFADPQERFKKLFESLLLVIANSDVFEYCENFHSKSNVSKVEKCDGSKSHSDDGGGQQFNPHWIENDEGIKAEHYCEAARRPVWEERQQIFLPITPENQRQTITGQHSSHENTPGLCCNSKMFENCGIGIRIKTCQSTGRPIVSGLADSGPAKLDGRICPDDIILRVNGYDATKLSRVDMMQLISGPEASQVHLEMVRPWDEKYNVILFRRRLTGVERCETHCGTERILFGK